MGRIKSSFALRTAGLVTLSSFLLSGCIAPDIEVVGAVGVGVSEDGEVKIFLESCDSATLSVSAAYDRDGLEDHEPNEELGFWSNGDPIRGIRILEPEDPDYVWDGDAVIFDKSRGYIFTAGGLQDQEVLTQVSFRAADLPDLDPDLIYVNTPDPEGFELVGVTRDEFTNWACSDAPRPSLTPSTS